MLKLGKVGLFDADNPPPGIWGTFAPGVRLKVRKLTAEVIRKIRKKYSKTEMQADNARRMVASEVLCDEQGYDDGLIDYIIEDFEGIGDEAGKPLPVTLESKKIALNYLPLKDWVWTFAQSADMTAEEAEG